MAQDSSREEIQTLTIDPQYSISVKDFGYLDSEELHYGSFDYNDYPYDEDGLDDLDYNDLDEDLDYDNDNNDTYNNSNSIRSSIINFSNYKNFQDGPPWQEDPDLKTPRLKNEDEQGEEYDFSITSTDEIHGKAIALFDFEPENDNEVALKEGQLIWISYRHGQGWLVAGDPTTGETGLVPEEYVQLINDEQYVDEDGEEPRQVFPQIGHLEDNDSDWVDEEDYDENTKTDDDHHDDDNNVSGDKLPEKLKNLNL